LFHRVRQFLIFGFREQERQRPGHERHNPEQQDRHELSEVGALRHKTGGGAFFNFTLNSCRPCTVQGIFCTVNYLFFFVRHEKFARTYHQFHLRSDHGPQSSEHGGDADQGHAQFGREHLRREHVDGVERYGDGVFAAQVQQYSQPVVI